MKKELETFIGIGGQVRYKCPNCGFDSYSIEMVAKHWLKSHKENEVPQAGPVLFDADDKPIEKEIKTDADLPEVFRSISTSNSRR